MKSNQRPTIVTTMILLTWIAATGATAEEMDRAGKILDVSGVQGGLVVHLGCRDGTLTAALGASGAYLVHGLDTSAENVAAARRHIRSLGRYGKVSVAEFDGRHLPYAENLVNLLVADDLGSVSGDEVVRVLAPGGVAYVSSGGAYSKTVKPWPDRIDEWGHHLHGPDGNPVAQDRVVGPPKRIQWQADPKYSRAHDSDSSTDALVTAGGRIFYMADEAPASLSGDNELPDKWALTARDAFNGVLLWKHPIKDWGWRAWKDTWYKGRADTYPRNIHRRLVAAGDKLYATLGYRAPVSELDAATGEILQTYAVTVRAREILYQNGQLILTVPEMEGLRLVVLDPVTGKRRWESSALYAGASTERRPAGRVELYSVLNAAADDDLVCLMDGKDLVCLDRTTGKHRWRVAPVPEGKGLWTGTLITSDGVVLYSEPRLLIALSADDGRTLWSLKTSDVQGLWFSWKDVFVIDGLVWTWSPETTARHPVAANGYDLRTGELKKTMPVGNVFNVDHHHRCYRNKATLRYIIASRRGAEYVDLEEGNHSVNIWVRGICFLGMMPANGFLYAPPHPCKCYINEKLSGFCALASRETGSQEQEAEGDRLHKGPAFGKAITNHQSSIINPQSSITNSPSWPTFRGDPARSGSTDAGLPAVLRPSWELELHGKLSAPVVAGGKLFVASVDTHTVHALDAASGKTLWSHTGGGRVDSPPTYYRGTVLFGSADGQVTCLRASDGALAWRFRAAPRQRLIGISSQLESAWPVHGTVLVDDNVAYVAAGRSSYLDGGIHVYGLDPTTGKALYHTVVEGPHIDLSNERWYDEPNAAHGLGSLADVLQAVEGRICMGNKVFDRQLRDGGPAPARTRALGGMLDDSQFRRFFWYYGREMTADLHTHLTYRFIEKLQLRHGLSAMLVNDRKSFYGVRRFDNTKLLDPRNHFEPGKGDLLFATAIGQEARAWSSRIPVRVTSMLVASDQLVIAGPPEAGVDPKDPLGTYEGRKGGILRIVSAATGEKINEYALEVPPVFNGLAAAGGRLYWSTTDGKVVCYEGKGARSRWGKFPNLPVFKLARPFWPVRKPAPREVALSN